MLNYNYNIQYRWVNIINKIQNYMCLKLKYYSSSKAHPISIAAPSAEACGSEAALT